MFRVKEKRGRKGGGEGGGGKENRMDETKGVFHLQKNSEIFYWEFPLRKARSICHKSHSREARPLNRPRKAWNW